MYNLQGQVAIVTGAASGIGRAIAPRLSREGAAVVAADLDGKAADHLAREITSLGNSVLPIAMDVAAESDVERMVKSAVENFRRIDILVNNAGVAERLSLEELDEATLDREIDVILRGTILCTQAVYPIMRAAGYGKIVNVSSISGKLGGALSRRPGSDRGRSGPAYAAAKGGVIAFTKWVARLLGFGLGQRVDFIEGDDQGPVDPAQMGEQHGIL